MKVLSIRQPWAWLIVNGFKDIENRTWPTNVRGPVLIHAGKQFDDDGELSVLLQFPEIAKQMPGEAKDYPMGGIVGMAEITNCVMKSDSPWFIGDFGFVLKNARPLPLYPLRGQLGFFPAPADFKIPD